MRPTAILLVLVCVLPTIVAARPDHRVPHFHPADAEQYDKSGIWSRPLERGPYAILPAETLAWRSLRDNVTLTAGVVRPDVPAGVKVPLLVRASPYLAPVTPESIPRDFEYSPRVENFVPHGYAVAFVPVRGTADDGGCIDLLGEKERDDLRQVVDALAEMPWSNGNVAIVGLSYDGSTAWSLASTGDPHVKTIVTMDGISDWYDWVFPNGTAGYNVLGSASLYWTFGFAVQGVQLEPNVERSPEHRVQGAVCPDMAEFFAAGARDMGSGRRSAFWDERDVRPEVLANYHGSVLFTEGLRDDNVRPSIAIPLAQELAARGIPVKMLLGQWPHAFPDDHPSTLGPSVSGGAPHAAPHQRWDWAQIQLRWYDRWLKDQRGVDWGPRVEVEDTSGRWRAEDAWPPADAAWSTLYPKSDGTLGAVPDATPGRVVVAGVINTFDTSDDYDSSVPCAGCAVFVGAPFSSERILTGGVPLRLTIASIAPQADVAARLVLVDASGARHLVTYALQNVEAPDATAPAVVDLWMQPNDVAIPMGTHLELEVAMAHPGWSAPLSAPLVLVTGGDATDLRYQSITRSGDDFFSPP